MTPEEPMKFELNEDEIWAIFPVSTPEGFLDNEEWRGRMALAGYEAVGKAAQRKLWSWRGEPCERHYHVGPTPHELCLTCQQDLRRALGMEATDE